MEVATEESGRGWVVQNSVASRSCGESGAAAAAMASWRADCGLRARLEWKRHVGGGRGQGVNQPRLRREATACVILVVRFGAASLRSDEGA